MLTITTYKMSNAKLQNLIEFYKVRKASSFEPGPQPADTFGESKMIAILVVGFLTSKRIFENFGRWRNCPVDSMFLAMFQTSVTL